MLQATSFERFDKQGQNEVSLGVLPLSHSYGLILAHAMIYRGDSIVLHPRFDMQAMLGSIAKYKIERLYLVSERRWNLMAA